MAINTPHEAAMQEQPLAHGGEKNIAPVRRSLDLRPLSLDELRLVAGGPTIENGDP